MKSSKCLSAFPVNVVYLPISLELLWKQQHADDLVTWLEHLYTQLRRIQMARIVTATSTCRVYVAWKLVHHLGQHWLYIYTVDLETTTSIFLSKIRNKRYPFQLWKMNVSSVQSIRPFPLFKVLSLCLWPRYICLHFHFVGQAWGAAWGPALQPSPPGREDYIPARPASSICNAGAQNARKLEGAQNTAVDSRGVGVNE